MNKKGLYEKYFKRLFDFIVSLIAFIVLSPLLLFLSLIVRIKLGSPIIFKQKRPGLNEKVFTLYKFRTMKNSKDEHGVLLPDSERLTKFGKFLRATSMDELPSLLNIIKGDLSIVGPRPLLVEYLSLYNDEQKKRHLVRPGLTGLAQVKGRNAISWEEKFDLDLLYMSKISFFYDIMIILLTIKKVIFREGINSSSAATMENFQGTKRN
jgi:lipopolysaccharide/colanic/teichoic acid biosynthesis glycosyltransferase